MNFDIEKILTELSKDLFSGNDVGEILNNPTEFPTEIIQKISIETALKYWNGDIDYEAGDCIMNNIFGFWVTNEFFVQNYGFSDIAWDCYNAFDAGEYIRKEDGPEIDPVEKYTKPSIEKILRNRNLIK